MVRIAKALIIDEPWISKILSGDKCWELRSRKTQFRGWFGLVRKGSGQVVGVAKLDCVLGPLSDVELTASEGKHRVGLDVYSLAGFNWRYAWQLSGARALDVPVAYQHKSGAVTWVTLDAETQAEIGRQVNRGGAWEISGSEQSAPDSEVAEKDGLAEKNESVPAVAENQSDRPERKTTEGIWLPVARDGTIFNPDSCNAAGRYTVGSKGDEHRFDDFSQALRYLRDMPTARWRRPNAAGNWGIVSAVEWKRFNQFEQEM